MGEYGFREENAYVLQGLSLCLEFTYGELAQSLAFWMVRAWKEGETKRNCVYPGNTKLNLGDATAAEEEEKDSEGDVK